MRQLLGMGTLVTQTFLGKNNFGKRKPPEGLSNACAFGVPFFGGGVRRRREDAVLGPGRTASIVLCGPSSLAR